MLFLTSIESTPQTCQRAPQNNSWTVPAFGKGALPCWKRIQVSGNIKVCKKDPHRRQDLLPIVPLGVCAPSRHSMWYKRKSESSEQASVFHCSIVQVWWPRAHGCSGQGSSSGPLTGLWLCRAINIDLWCTAQTLIAYIRVSDPALTSLAIWAAAVGPLSLTARASRHTPPGSISGCQFFLHLMNQIWEYIP